MGYSNNSISVINSCNIAPVSNGTYSGGLIGYSGNNSSVFNSYNKGTLYSVQHGSCCYSGGIIGYNHGTTTISICFNNGNITSEANVYSNAFANSGGIIGYSDNTVTLEKCYNTAVISGLATSTSGSIDVNVGGIIGYLSASANSIHECYNTGNISSIVNCKRWCKLCMEQWKYYDKCDSFAKRRLHGNSD